MAQYEDDQVAVISHFDTTGKRVVDWWQYQRSTPSGSQVARVETSRIYNIEDATDCGTPYMMS